MSDQIEWWRGGVIYQIYPRSFMDANGDGIGDLKGITQKLDYVADLGVDGIWISPFFKSPMKDFGYDVADYREVDPMFGCLNDFKELLDKAHSLNLKVMIDQVWSHSSNEHEWFIESRESANNAKSDWYIWAEAKPDGTPPNNWLSYFGGPAWTWDTKRKQYYLHHFLREQPALNIWNTDVRAELIDTARFWFDMGVDGFRLDAMHQYLADPLLRDNPARTDGSTPSDLPPENPLSMQSRTNSANHAGTIEWLNIIREISDEYQDRALMAEVGGEDAAQVAANYVQASDRFHFAYTFDLFSCSYNKSDMEALFKNTEEVIGTGWLCWSNSNHDVQRVASRWYPGQGNQSDFNYQASILPMSMRGSYCMYQGEELGFKETDVPFEKMQDPYGIEFYPEFKGRDGCRTPMAWDHTEHGGFSAVDADGNLPEPWLPLSQQHIEDNVSWQKEHEGSIYYRMKKYIAWRKKEPAMRTGAVELIESGEENILAFVRSEGDDHIMCVFNFSYEEKIMDQKLLKDGQKLIENISSAVKVEGDQITLMPFAVALFK